LQQTGIDLLHPKLIIDFGSAFSFQNDTGDPDHSIPDRKIGDGCVTRNRKNVFSFLRAAPVISKDLLDADSRVLMIDPNLNVCFVQSKNGWIRFLILRWKEDSDIGLTEKRDQAK
jgi:hypothetical protein